MARQNSGRGRPGRGSGRSTKPPKDRREIEWQFDATDLETVGSWLREHSSGTGLVVVPESEQRISDTYYDTEDWRFYRAGYGLRVRKTGNKTNGGVEATMKSLPAAEGDAGDKAEGSVRWRREITEPLPDDEPVTLAGASGPVGERSRRLLGTREMRPLFAVETRRQSFALMLDDHGGESENGSPENSPGNSAGGLRIGEVVLDASEIPLGGDREAARLSRVEVEAGAGTAPTPDLRGFVDELQYALDLRPASLSKYETGLYATGLSPRATTETGPVEIDPSMTLGGVAFAVLRRQFARMQNHEPGTRLGEDPEAVHDMRVATRRMRSAIKVFERGLPERAKWFGGELRWVAHALGDVRDLDVQIGRLEAWRDEIGDGIGDEVGGDDARFLGKIIDVLEGRRTEARGRMLAALDSERYERFEASLGEMLRRGTGAELELARGNGHDPGREPVVSAAPALVSGRFRKWNKAAKRLGEDSPPEAFHDLRKKGKRLRYTLEFLSEVYGKPTRRLIKPLKSLQDDLGDHQDAVVAADTLRALGTATGGPRTPRGVAYAAGVLSERCRREASDLRATVPESRTLRELVKGKDWRGLKKAMGETAEDARKAKRKTPGKAVF